MEASIRNFGFVLPVLSDHAGEIVAGEARVAAAKRSGLTEVSTIGLITSVLPRPKRIALLLSTAAARRDGNVCPRAECIADKPAEMTKAITALLRPH